jgi:hypothetical protein
MRPEATSACGLKLLKYLLIEILNAAATLFAHSALSMQRHLRRAHTHTARTRPPRSEHVRSDNLPAPSP